MEIIRHRNTVKCCENCGCIFKYEKSDVKTKRVHGREDIGIILPHYVDTRHRIEYVCCPDCDKQIEINCEKEY